MMANKHDVRIDRSKLHPYLDVLLDKMLKECAKSGIYLIITEGIRTVQRQDELYAQGRTKPGVVVTRARGLSYSSQHQWGIAFDIAINDPNKLYDDALFRKAAAIGKSVGLSWGGDWKSFIDKPHFYIGKWGPTTDVLKKKYGTPDVFKKTWTATVKRKKGIRLFRNKSRKNLIGRIPYGSTVEVLYRCKLRYAKIRYKDNVGYALKRFLK